jgi:hypothetical protein
MAHNEQRVFIESVRERWPDFFTKTVVLEVGSLDINGSVRDFFTDCDYTGVDLAPGPGVDVVGEGQHLTFDDDSFDVAISAECFEHNPSWVATFANMHRMASGLVVMTCASEGRPEHGTARCDPDSSPFTAYVNEYYRNLTADDFHAEFDMGLMFSEYFFSTNKITCDLYFWGIKRKPVV